MNEFIMFLTENATWLLVVVALIIIIIIGFLVDKKKTSEKVELKTATPPSSDIPTFIHNNNNNNSTEKKPEDTLMWNNMPPKTMEDQKGNVAPFGNNPSNGQQTNSQMQGMNNNIQTSFIPPQNVSPMSNQPNQPQPANMANMQPQASVMNNFQNNPSQQLQGIGNPVPGNFIPPQNMSHMSNQPNQQQAVNIANMQPQSPVMNNFQNNSPQQLQGIGNPVPGNFIPPQNMNPMNNQPNQQQAVNMVNMQPQPPVMNAAPAPAPTHEPIKVSPIPGMTGTAVSFVNGPVNNNPNQQ